MKTFNRIFLSAIIAGTLAGIFVAALHYIGTSPLILKAEVYEKAQNTSDAANGSEEKISPPETHIHANGTTHIHDHASWEPENGLERSALTIAADILTSIGFSFLLVAAYALKNIAVTWRTGIFWGLAGFAIFSLAPGLGLPPEVPGAESAPLSDRQIWWLATVIATAGGLGMLAFAQRAAWVAAGAILIALPHLIGAPQPMEDIHATPYFLEKRFISIALVTSFLFWLLLGALSGFFYNYLNQVRAGIRQQH